MSGLLVKLVRVGRPAARTVASLDKPVGSDTDTSFGDMVAQDDTNLEESVVVALGEDALHRAIATLPDRERFVITARYGLGEEEPRSLEMIGREMGITRERVRQIERQALNRLAQQRNGTVAARPPVFTSARRRMRSRPGASRGARLPVQR